MSKKTAELEKRIIVLELLVTELLNCVRIRDWPIGADLPEHVGYFDAIEKIKEDED